MRLCLSVLCVLLFSTACHAQDWVRDMFKETSHDFGVVARGAKVEHKFSIENLYEEDLHITSVRSSCGCTSPKVNKTTLKTGEKGELTATIDTRAFSGTKEATVTVTFEVLLAGERQPLIGEMQLNVHVFIRSDVVVQPGVIQFGSVDQGVGAKQRAAISYAGREDWEWKIVRVECANPQIEARAVETSRTPGRANYDLEVTLKADAPPGSIHDQLFLVTNDYDQRAAKVPVAIEGVVAAPITVRPNPLSYNVVKEGDVVTKTLIIKAKKPFRVSSVRSSEPRFVAKASDEAKTVQQILVTFDSKGASGKIAGKLHIETDQDDAALDVNVNAQVTPQ